MKIKKSLTDRLRTIATMALAALFLAVAHPAAMAGVLDGAKQQGYVGEQLDGYAGIVNQSAPDDVRQLVDSVNQQRRAEYERIATETNSTPEQVGYVIGTKLINRAPVGHYVMDVQGQWVVK